MNHLPIVGLEHCRHLLLHGLFAIYQDTYDTYLSLYHTTTAYHYVATAGQARPSDTLQMNRLQVLPISDEYRFNNTLYLWTQEGWLYVAVLLDLYSRKVVGWSLRSHVDSELVKGALEMAIDRRHPEAGLIHHTDRGSPYAAHAYREMLREHAMAERFFGSLKRERTSHRHDETRQEARDEVVSGVGSTLVDYIEMFYNSTRLHSYLGYMSPNAYEKMPRAA